MTRFLVYSFLLFFGAQHTFAQEVWMHPNAGQWDDRIEYKVDLQMGEMLIESDGFTYFLNNAKQKFGHSHGEEEHEGDDTHFQAHVVRMKFTGSNWKGRKAERDSSRFYTNYILGNDKSKWKSKIHSFSKIALHDYYENVDLAIDGSNGELKYSFKLSPNTDPNTIQMEFEGQDSIFIDEQGYLHIAHRFGEIIESYPMAWTEIEGKKTKVEVEFNLFNNILSFVFPNGYDQSQNLVIDPNLTFSTFSGSSADNWGFTAAPDDAGNLFGAGVVFAQGYPISTGAYDAGFNGGTVDVGVTKFTSDGSSLIYSTYIGGSGSETPNSIVCSTSGELFIFGITSSPNFPMAGSSYDNSYAGGPSIPNSSSNSLGFTGGADLYVARLNSTGSALIASTYIGGNDTDGMNTTNLKFNYGDQFRGEIIVDNNGSVYVASTTQSSNFPVVQGTQGALSGSQDAVLFKMPESLNTLNWSTYFGGTGNETGNSVQISSTGEVYLTGGTSSGSLPFSTGFDLTFGGVVDGYVARFNGSNGSVISGSYMGAAEYDQAYFVQLDIDDDVYILGQTETNLGVSAGHYGTPNSGQYIYKYSGNLSSLLWTTMIGAGSGHVEISPTAFLVSDCYDIYLSGWGGVLNANASVSQAVNSSTNGFTTTPGCHQAGTNGSNFYIAVLDQDAFNLKYATFMGGMTSSSNHVDGGTSRFDKSGRIYHAVCGACGGNPNGFTTTPGVWSPTNQSSNCNLAAFKFELSTIEAVVAAPDPIVCLPDPVIFNNNSANGNAFFWDFGDNTFSTDINPSHLYPGPGIYTVTLVVTDTNGCFSPDSIEFIVNIGDFTGSVTPPPGPICPGDSYQFEASGGIDYVWTPAQFLDDPTIYNPTATVNQTTDFMVIISDSCGIDTVYVTLPVFLGGSSISNDTSICIGNSVDLFANGGVSYTWTPDLYLDDPFIATPVSTPDADIVYTVEIITSNGCVLTDSVAVDVYYTPPVPILPDTVYLCYGATAEIIASGGDTYLWSPNINISSLTDATVYVDPLADITYYCDFINACGMTPDSVFVDIVAASILAGTDTIICPGQSVNLWAQGGVSYSWTPSSSLNSNNTSLVTATPFTPTMYYVIGVDEYGCTNSDSVWVDLYPQAFIQTNPDVYAFYGDQIQLSATSTTTGPFIWDPAEFLSCVVCPDPIAIPNQNYFYTVSYTDENGCSAMDSVHIYYDPILYVPNTFTPNGDGMNPTFLALGGNIKVFEMLIFNRWGELIFTSDNINSGWDGKFDGKICQDGTYVWKIKITDFTNEEHDFVGHVNLLR